MRLRIRRLWGRVVERVVPARLGTSFRWLFSAAMVTSIGDGFALAAGPLLIASLTRDPRVVSAALLAQWLPPLLFGLQAGALADRLDRRRLIIAVDVVRTVFLTVLAIFVATGRVSVPIVLVVLFLTGIAETFADTTAETLLPMMVDKKDLGLANARLMAGFVTLNELAGPPIGAFLFAVGMAIPFGVQAVAMACGVVLVSRIVTSAPGPRTKQTSIRHDVAEGTRWLWNHAPLRTLALTVFAFNITFGAAWSVMVLYATEWLGMGEVGFGLLTTVMALGGLVGTALYRWLEAKYSLANIMRGGLIIETLTHLCLALTRTPWVAMVMLFFFGAHAYVWGTTSTAVRQRATPTELQGRVGSVDLLASVGGLVIGAPIGGFVANRWNLAAPFWFAFFGSLIILIVIWGALEQIAHADEKP